jgi:hypothetical protein
MLTINHHGKGAIFRLESRANLAYLSRMNMAVRSNWEGCETE